MYNILNPGTENFLIRFRGWRDSRSCVLVTRAAIDSDGKWNFSLIKGNFKLVYQFLFFHCLVCPYFLTGEGKIEFYRCRVTIA